MTSSSMNEIPCSVISWIDPFSYRRLPICNIAYREVVPRFQVATKKFTQVDKSRLPAFISLFFFRDVFSSARDHDADYAVLDIIAKLGPRFSVQRLISRTWRFKRILTDYQEAMNRTRLRLMRSLETLTFRGSCVTATRFEDPQPTDLESLQTGLLAFVSRTTWFAIIGRYASCTLQQRILERRGPPVLFQQITKGLIEKIIKTGATVARKIIQSLQDAGINRN